nr:hypothetical protein 8 [Gammaproteobacteria bacterium]
MATKKSRQGKKTKKKIIPKGYDSRLEYDLHKQEMKGWGYHPEERITYEVPHTYEPDFTAEICTRHADLYSKCRCGGKRKEILVEVKGRFRERKEATKYVYVREALAEKNRQNCFKKQEHKESEKELIFLFQDADKPMPFAQRRKNGTKQTHGEWAEKNGFRFFCLKKGLPKQWLKTLI